MSHHHNLHGLHARHDQPDEQPQAESSLTFDPGDLISPQQAATANLVDVAAQLENTHAEVQTLKAQVVELTDQAMRAQAEAQNVRRRAEEEVAKSRKFAVESFAESLLPVLDSLEAALATQDATAAQLREGSEATLKQLAAALERNKVTVIAPEPGSKFDPARQHAIGMTPSDQEPNTIVGVLQKGYLIAERVLRPALVTVAAPK
ncbi:MAG: nucleotide exchange factor GrpE [Burkholderiaceae bacterium]|jgi:molecular chaperone GrpE|nr:nucleotide exchange factor GrpE [Burkholderiaceae bacterium]